jgi:hypothetical protein
MFFSIADISYPFCLYLGHYTKLKLLFQSNLLTGFQISFLLGFWGVLAEYIFPDTIKSLPD